MKVGLATNLRRVCAWCEAVLDEGTPGAEITHGICERCMEAFLNQDTYTLESFLESL